MRGRQSLIVLFVVTFVAGATTAVLAAGGDSARQRLVDGGPRIAGIGKGGGCRMGFDTESSTLIPPDDSTADNAPAGVVGLTKACNGPVVGQFTGEVSTSTAGDFIHLDMRATCVGTGGFTTHCTVGEQVYASPGHTFFQNAQSGVQTHSMDMVWDLLPGQWTFEVLPGGNNRANLQFRTFTVEAFAK